MKEREIAKASFAQGLLLQDQIKKCQRFVKRLRKVVGEEPENTRLELKVVETESGKCCEVWCYFDLRDPVSTTYVFNCAVKGKVRWEFVQKGGKLNDEVFRTGC